MPKRRWNSDSIHVYWVNIHVWVNPGQQSCIVTCIHWNFEYTKAVTLHCAKVGGGMDQGPTTQVTHLRLNQPFSFCSAHMHDTDSELRKQLQSMYSYFFFQ